MEQKTIRLIASDMDGTILLNGAQAVDASLLGTIRQVLDMGILFAPASGRQVVSLKRLFAPVADDLMYIGENGALVKYKNETLVKTPLDRKLALEIIDDIMSVPNCEVLVSGEETSYIKPKTKQYYHRMTQVVNYHTTLVEDFASIPEDILKVAVCDLSGIVNSQEHFAGAWSSQAAVTVSGQLYMDFMDKNVSKGNAMRKIQQKLGIGPEDCMAFGDNYNDIEMLDAVGHAYVMEKSVPDVKAHGSHIARNVEEVLKRDVLKTGIA